MIRRPSSRKKRIENNSPKFHLTEGLFIAAVPLLGYFVAFTYELSYAFTFGYSISFISIGIEAILFSTFITLFALIVFYYIVFGLFSIDGVDYSSAEFLYFILGVMVVYFAFSSLSIRIGQNWTIWIILLCIFLVLIIGLSLILWEKDKNKRLGGEFITALFKALKVLIQPLNILKKFNISVALLTLIVLLLITSSFFIGQINSEDKTIFYVINNDKEEVVLNINNDKLIVGTIDTVTNEILNYSIVNALKNNISLSKMYIGKLRPKPIQEKKSDNYVDSLKQSKGESKKGKDSLP